MLRKSTFGIFVGKSSKSGKRERIKDGEGEKKETREKTPGSERGSKRFGNVIKLGWEDYFVLFRRCG